MWNPKNNGFRAGRYYRYKIDGPGKSTGKRKELLAGNFIKTMRK
jgi:hypothetical protein